MGRELGVPDLEAVGMAHLGGAALDQGRVEEGLRLLDQASAIAATEDFQLALSPGWTLCCTITGCEVVGDFGRAAQWAGAMFKTGERWHGRHMNAMCRSAYGKVLATRGDWPGADSELVAAVADIVPTRPAQSGGALVKLGELRARQGRAEEARELFGRAGAHPGAVLGLGTMAWKEGDSQAAADAADRVLRRVPEGSLLDRLPALELLALAKAGLGRDERGIGGLRRGRRAGSAPGHHLPPGPGAADRGGGDQRARRPRGVAPRLRGRDRPLLRELGSVRARALPDGAGPGAARARSRRTLRTQRPPKRRRPSWHWAPSGRWLRRGRGRRTRAHADPARARGAAAGRARE